MEEFKSNQGPVRLASTESHVVIVDDAWTVVPDCLVGDALKARLIPKSLYEEARQEVEKDAADKNPQDPQPPADQPAGDATKTEKVMSAMAKVSAMVEAGDTETEGGNKLVHNGRPMVAAVSEIAGFKVSGADIEEALG